LQEGMRERFLTLIGLYVDEWGKEEKQTWHLRRDLKVAEERILRL